MAALNLISGDDGSNTLQGTAGPDLIYGFDPNGPQGNVTSIAATRVASGLHSPLFITAAPGDTSRLFIVEQTGAIKILDLNTGQVLATPFLNVTVDSSGERGLLGLAFDPNYATNGLFYIYRTVPGATAHNEVDRYHVSANPNVADAASGTPIISLGNLSAATNHNAGWIGFGPDNDLYIATGENANAPNSQTLSNLLGKILRIDVHSGTPYTIPADNPFVGVAGARGEIFALGLRNPFRDSFDRATGDFFVADVGQNTIEEVNRGISGANYGWPSAEGPSSNPAFTNPIFSYDHTVGQAIIGGYVYRGTSEGLQGQYFYADEVAGKVFTLRFNGSAWVSTERTSQITANAGAINNPTSFGEDAVGNLYLADFDGDIFKLTPQVVSLDQADILNGNGGDDTLFGGAGNDMLFGGTGIDTAVYSAASSAYKVISFNGSVAVLSHGSDGKDLLSGVENLRFSDKVAPASTATPFDANEYVASNPDLIQSIGLNQQAGFDHYLFHGFDEGRSTNSFDPLEYLASNTDLISAFGLNTIAAEQHYITNGFNEHRVTNSFDALEYLASNTDLIQAFGLNITAAEQHYITNGFNEHRATNSFDALEYIASNSDLIHAFHLNLALGEQHYVTNGFNEHRGTASFNAAQYLANYADLSAAFGNNLIAARQHYITNGFDEGRTDQAPVINGDGGDNTLVARNGATMTGGAGADTFVFNASLLTPATITDFTVGGDHLQISASGFGHGLTAGGTAPLVTAATASSANHAGPDGYFIFDNASTVWWDPTGGSGADAIAEVKLTGVASLHASDFLLV
jgi:glucose/arabinose dehydrogenase